MLNESYQFVCVFVSSPLALRLLQGSIEPPEFSVSLFESAVQRSSFCGFSHPFFIVNHKNVRR